MNKQLLFSLFLLFAGMSTAFAGNPDRQGEAGAYELLMNPYARSAGLHTLSNPMVKGAEAMRINPAGVARIRNTQITAGYSIYLEGTSVNMSALSFAQKVGENGAFGLSLMSLDFGDILVTTVNLPGGDGTTYSPSFFNIGLSYSHVFENKVSVGILARGISQSLADINAFGLAVDAGVQYVTGPKDNFKLGVSLRNVGSKMRFGGQGLSFQGVAPNDNIEYNFTANQRAAPYELPTQLHIGAAYDIYIDSVSMHRVTLLGNFTANSFSRDIVGGGIEYSFRELFFLRGAYAYEVSDGEDEDILGTAYTGLSFGAGIYARVGKKKETEFQFDYAYRVSNPFGGTHNIGLTIDL